MKIYGIVREKNIYSYRAKMEPWGMTKPNPFGWKCFCLVESKEIKEFLAVRKKSRTFAADLPVHVLGKVF